MESPIAKARRSMQGASMMGPPPLTSPVGPSTAAAAATSTMQQEQDLKSNTNQELIIDTTTPQETTASIRLLSYIQRDKLQATLDYTLRKDREHEYLNRAKEVDMPSMLFPPLGDVFQPRNVSFVRQKNETPTPQEEQQQEQGGSSDEENLPVAFQNNHRLPVFESFKPELCLRPAPRKRSRGIERIEMGGAFRQLHR